MIINFFHIEKTGGVTFRDIYMKRYKPHEIFDIVRSRDFDKRVADLKVMHQDKRNEIKFVVGHQFFGVHQYFNDDMRYLTMLREPISRVISCYMSYKRKRDAPLHKLANELPLYEFIESQSKLHFDNGMARVLCGQWPDQPGYGEIGREHFEQARMNLINRCYIGLTEHYDETLIYFREKIGGAYPFYTKANFAKETKPIIDERTKDLIRDHNRWDTELYQCAEKLFWNQIKSVMIDGKIKRFKLLNKTVGRAFIGRRAMRKFKRSSQSNNETKYVQIGETYPG